MTDPKPSTIEPAHPPNQGAAPPPPAPVGASESASKKAELETLRAQEDVRQALKQTGSPEETEQPVAAPQDKAWFATHAILFLALGAFRLGLSLRLFELPAQFLPVVDRISPS
jgi:hypothetical protein